MGRGLRKRNPNCRNTLWHWRTPKRAPYCRSIHADKALPSHRLPAMPTSRGALRRTASTSPHCFGLSRRGRPGRSPSCKPANPASSKRRTQYSTERGASPSKAATLGRSNLVPLRARHVSGDRSVILRIVESHPAAQEPPWRSQQREVLSCPHENTVSHYAQLLMSLCLE